MGIDGFYNWLKTEYKDCFVPCGKKAVYDYIYIDANHILHNSINKVTSESAFIDKLYKALDLIFSNFIATKKVIIAVDGTSPYSKILLQRKRRSSAIETIDVSNINSLHLTPGTQFMKDVDKYITQYIDKINSSTRFIETQYRYIPSTKPDEGELKVFRELIKYSSNDPFSCHLVIGNDADLVILAMALQSTNGIDVLIRHNHDIETLNIDSLIDKYTSKLGSIKFKSKWRLDFCVISLMLGNDYFPKLYYIKYQNLWKSYISFIKSIDTKHTMIRYDGNYDKQMLIKFFEVLVNNLSQQYRKFSIEYYDKQMVKNYMCGIFWCLEMYKTGKCPMYDYIYNYKRAPSPTDVLHYLKNEEYNISIPTSSVKPIKFDIYTLLVMPKKARKLVPQQYQHLIDDQLKYIYEVEVCDKCNSLKNKIKLINKKLYAERRSSKNEERINILKNKSNKLTLTLNNHKTVHKNKFNINDINKIIKLTNNI